MSNIINPYTCGKDISLETYAGAGLHFFFQSWRKNTSSFTWGLVERENKG
jgi:hypothetical protein